jgi:hypothetical protein
MKKLLLLLFFLTGLSLIANAQITQKSPEQLAAHITKVLSKRLNLTADQASQVNSAFLNQATRIDSLKNNPSIDPKINNLTRRSILLLTQKQVLSVLNDEQKTQFIEWEKMKKEKHNTKKAESQTPDSQG